MSDGVIPAGGFPGVPTSRQDSFADDPSEPDPEGRRGSKHSAGATAALQQDGRDILGASCTVSLSSTLTASNESLDRNGVRWLGEGAGALSGRTPTTAEWIQLVMDSTPEHSMASFEDDGIQLVTEEQAARSVLVQGLPVIDLQQPESSLVEVFQVYGRVDKLILQTIRQSQTQRAVVVFKHSAGATAALQQDGRDILGASCTVSLSSTLAASNESLDRNGVRWLGEGAEGALSGRTPTTAEWIQLVMDSTPSWMETFEDDGIQLVTEEQAARSVLVQGLPILGQRTTESSLVEVFSAYGRVSRLLLQTIRLSQTQRALVVFAESEGATAALQHNDRDILGASCSVSLPSALAASNERLDRDNVHWMGEAEGALSGRTPTAEWIQLIFEHIPTCTVATLESKLCCV